MTSALIREARPGDEHGIHEAHMRSIREICVKDHGEEEIRGWGHRPLGSRWIEPIREGRVWVVEQPGAEPRIQGMACMQIHEEHGVPQACIQGLYLTPDVVGRGLGAQLLQRMLERARAAGVTTVTLSSSITAHGFYERFGFVDSAPMQWVEIGGSQVRSFPMTCRL